MFTSTLFQSNVMVRIYSYFGRRGDAEKDTSGNVGALLDLTTEVGDKLKEHKSIEMPKERLKTSKR